MEFEKIRHHFSIYVVDSEQKYCDLIGDALKSAGYHVECFLRGEEAIQEVQKHVPHVVIAGTYLTGLTGVQLLEQVRDLSRDIFFILAANYAESDIVQEAISLGAYDSLIKPIQNIGDVISKIDRIVERVYLDSINEEVYQKLVTSQKVVRKLRKKFVAERNLVIKSTELIDRLETCEEPKKALDIFLQTLSHLFSESPVVFFRHTTEPRALLVSRTVGFSDESLQGVSVPLESLEFDLEKPDIKELLSAVLKTETICLIPFTVEKKTVGLFCLQNAVSAPFDRKLIKQLVQVFEIKYAMISLKKANHDLRIKDEATGFLLKAAFEQEVVEEISRARRIKWPVSVLYIGIDQHRAQDKFSSLEWNAMVKKFAAIVKKTSRNIDTLGRLNDHEFLILLPHTDKLGAAVKAEKLRRLVERTPLLGDQALSLSIGVSEYPSLSADAEGLIFSADSAYFQVKKVGNKVCLAVAASGLEPDFVVEKS